MPTAEQLTTNRYYALFKDHLRIGAMQQVQLLHHLLQILHLGVMTQPARTP